MRHLNGWLAARVLAIESQQAVTPQNLQHRLNGLIRHVQRIGLGAGYPPPCIGPALAERDQTQEYLAHGATTVAVEI